jgi:ribosomal protein S12 methylthiotransferase
MKVGFISLGCSKNLVDSEMIISLFKRNNFEIIDNAEEADIVVINTCGFIDSAKQESIDTIFEYVDPNKITIVTGCLVERYKEELEKEIPEVDLFISIRDYPHMAQMIQDTIQKKYPSMTMQGSIDLDKRVLTTGPFSAYLKISEGCNNRCAFCAIPLIRGNFRSVPKEEILKQAEHLRDQGIEELVVISQDTTKYGMDLRKQGIKTDIVDLLKSLLEYPEFKYIRLLYLYPQEVTDELIDLIASEPRLTKYFDLPIQHSETRVLRSMLRHDTRESTEDVINRIRKRIPDAIIRTTLIVGFPGETDEDFNNLVEFIKKEKFDHLGAFTYSREEGTKSYDYENQVDEEVKQARYNKIMKTQKAISLSNNKKRKGEIHQGIVIDYNFENNVYYLRSGFNAPDDIDGKIIFKSDRPLAAGDIVKVKITSCDHYNLYGVLIDD